MTTFADKVTLNVAAGRGGDGLASFRHEKYRAKGGPDGGDGGAGGSVVLQADHNLNTLAAFKTRPSLTAPDGARGGKNRSHGKSGADVVAKVPLGTMVYDGEQLLADLATDGDQLVAAQGGRGGFGNAHFASSVRQAPRVAELGEAGQQRELTLELKLVAAVGLVGLPNAGKSTLLARISAAKPEIGDYPFTTLVPNLGVARHRGDTFLVADIPGLIAGASQGKGLGDDFLRHIERTRVLVHLIDATAPDPVADYHVIQQELRSYRSDLSLKPQLTVLTKADAASEARLDQLRPALLSANANRGLYIISAASGQGLDKLLDDVVKHIKAAELEIEAEAPADIKVINQASQPDLWEVVVDSDGISVSFRVEGAKIEQFAARTNFNQPQGVERLLDIMRKLGITGELERQGAKSGDIIKIGQAEFLWP